MTSNSVIKSGTPFPPRTHSKYEKTSSDYEYVAGRIASKGTADYQYKLYVADSRPAGVFDKQPGNEGRASATGNYNDNYCLDTKDCNVKELGVFTFKGLLKDGNAATKYNLLDAEAGTGKLVVHVAGRIPVAIAMESVTASGADADIEALFNPYLGELGSLAELVVATETQSVAAGVATLTYIPQLIEYVEGVGGGQASEIIVTEDLTVSGHTVTLAHVPTMIEYLEVTTADGPLIANDLEVITDTGLAVSSHVATLTRIPVAFLYIEGNYKSTTIHAFSPQVTAVAATDLDAVAVDAAAKTLTFHATDAVQTGTVNVCYLSRTVTKRTGMNIIVTGTVQRGEAKVVYSTGVITFHALDNVTAAKIRYRYSEGAKTSLHVIVNGTQRQGEVKAVYASKTLTINATDAHTSLKVRYWYDPAT